MRRAIRGGGFAASVSGWDWWSEMDGKLHYTDTRDRVWEITKKGMRWFAKTESQAMGVMDFNLYQLFEQIDKRP